MRVFVGPIEIAGIGAGYVEGLRANGVQADLVTVYPHPFRYDADRVADWIPNAWARVGGWRRRERSVWRKALAIGLQQVLGWAVVLWALPRYDAFVFLYGQTITNTTLELWLLRVAGKRVGTVFVGSDARPPYIDGNWFPADRPFDAAAAARAARRQRCKVARLERGSSFTVNARATAQFQSRRFVNWFALGIARRADASPPPPSRPTLRVLHSPSHAVLKGTAEVRRAIEQMHERGLAVELVTIEGRANAEVLRALPDCDLVVDQLYSDTPMAAFATEAAGAGRPVIVAGLGADRAAAQVAPFPLPPTVYVRPEAFEAALERLLRDAPARAAVGAAGAAFVAEHASPRAVGARLVRILRGDIPDAWWCEPAAVDYVGGCGLPESVARQRVAALLRHGGTAALQVEDKPALQSAFAAFAAGSGGEKRLEVADRGGAPGQGEAAT